MPRIAKSEVNAALKTVATAIIKAGGNDGRTSRAEMTAALKSLPRAQRPLADIFFKFVDHRDFKKGAQVTAKDVTRAVDYAKTHMIAKYDLNNNGLSKDEISKMSLTGKRAVDLAKALKGAGAVDGGGKLDAAKLGVEINKFAGKANYMSESDYSPEYLSASFPGGHDLNGHNVMTAFEAPLKKLFEGNEGSFPGDYTFDTYSAPEAKEFIRSLSGVGSAETDAGVIESAKAFGEITALMKANLTDLHVFKIGPKDTDGSLAQDHGLYAQVVVGRTADGKVAAIMIGNVQT